MPKKISWLLSALLLISVVSPVLAISGVSPIDQDARNKSREKVLGLMKEGKLTTPEVKVTQTAKREEIKENRCETVTSRINAKLNFYEENKVNYNNRYSQYQDAVNTKAREWKNAGCDVTTLETQLSVMEQRMNEFAAAFRDFKLSLQGTRAYVCGESQGKFVGSLTETNQKLAIMKQKALELRNYTVNTLKPAVRTQRQTCELKVVGES